MTRYAQSLASLVLMVLCAYAPAQAERPFHVSPTGDDDAPGTPEAPFQTLYRAQEAVREAAPGMGDVVVVNLAPGEYRLNRTLEFTEVDSGRNGHRVVYRSAGGLGQARLLGSVALIGWKEYRDGIWKIDLPEGMTFHTLYENGRRAW
ncbi:MAG: right-handed parallel beta-helix repeat-containing protein, partial [Planctomycetes bacterium]|nr:right-handed parallel beta-helix repeat-containing protein [Planctomycetota bacterium]